MQLRKNPEYLRSIAQAVIEFQDAMDGFLKLHIPFEGGPRGLVPPIIPREDADQGELARVTREVGRLAGRASVAAELTNVVIAVQGLRSPINPIAAWQTIIKPKPLLEPDDILTACDQMIGRLEHMVLEAEHETAPSIDPEVMHPLIWGAARSLWRDGHHRDAVKTAAEALVGQVRSLTGRYDVEETSLWEHVFSPNAPKLNAPRLRWPGDPGNLTTKSMINGLVKFAPGVQMTIRNPLAHGEELGMGPDEALERLAVLSLLARWVEKCQLIEVPEVSD